MADISSIKLPDNNTYTIKDTTARNLAAAAGTVKSVQVQATSPVQSSTSTAQTATLNTTISLADGYGDTKNPYASKTKNYVLAAPSTADGAPNFRALTVSDLPTITTDKLVRPNQIKAPVGDVTLDSKINTLRANRLAFLPADQIIIEKTTDGGTTWVDAGISDAVKVGLFSETRAGVSVPLLNGVKNIDCGLRITFTAMKYNVPAGTAETAKYNYWNSNYVLSAERYNQLKEMYFWVSTNSDGLGVKLERANGATSTTWSTIFNNTSWAITGWPGNDYIRFSQAQFGGGTNQTTQPWNYRLTFFTRGADGSTILSTSSTTSAQSIMEIRGYGDAWWQAGNEYAANDHLYSHDYNKNATFPAQVTATQFNGALNGTATTATNVQTQGAATNSTARHIWFSDSTTETKRAHDDNLKYTPSTNTITANISGNAATATKATQDASGNVITTTYATKSELPTASTTNPLMNGTASYGSGTVYARSNHVHPTDTSRQATLVSGTNIKTINNNSLLGSGNVAVQPTLVSGTNIKTINNTSILGSGDFSLTEEAPNDGNLYGRENGNWKQFIQDTSILKAGTKCILIGNSFSYGTGADGHGWAYWLKQHTGIDEVAHAYQNGGDFLTGGNTNATYPGLTYYECFTQQILANQLTTEEQRNEIQFIIFGGGYNDYDTAANIRDAIKQMIDLLKANFKNAQLVFIPLAGCTNKSMDGTNVFSHYKAFISGWSRGASSKGCLTSNNSRYWFAGRSSTYGSDNIHLNEAGYELAAYYIEATIKGWNGSLLFDMPTTHSLDTTIVPNVDSLQVWNQDGKTYIHGHFDYTVSQNFSISYQPDMVQINPTFSPANEALYIPVFVYTSTSRQLGLIRILANGYIGLRYLTNTTYPTSASVYIDTVFEMQG